MYKKQLKNIEWNEWIKIIRECHSSGQTVKSWCSENDIRITKYYYWLRKIPTAACKAPPSIKSEGQIVPLSLICVK